MKSFVLPAPLTVALLAAALAALIIAATPIAPPAAASEPMLSLEKPKLAEMRQDEARALALLIENHGGADDRLLGARSEFFQDIRLQDRGGAAIEGLAIPAGATRAISPIGDAVLLLGAPLTYWPQGALATVVLEFERSGPMRLTLRAGPRPSGGLSLLKAERTIDTKGERKDDDEGFVDVPKEDPE